MIKSTSLIRTTPKLTSNVKLVVDSDYNMFLESYDSMAELSIDRYKKFQFNEKDLYDYIVPYFFRDLPTNIAYSVKYDDDSDKTYEDYRDQYDDMYLSGCSVTENNDYKEQFECIAPLHINKYNIPSNFIIFRVDGPGVENLTKNNFTSEILNNFKCVKNYDLSKKTPLGVFLNNNYTENTKIPLYPVDLDVRKTEFSKWGGIEYTSGGYCEKSVFLEDWFEKEKTFHHFDEFLTDGFEDNKVIYPNIINFKFMFDDTPTNEYGVNKWSMNRYMGFYINDMDKMAVKSLYSPYMLEPNLKIATDNICVDGNGDNIKPIIKVWDEDIRYFIEYRGNFYRISRFEINGNGDYKYKIISDIDLYGKELNLNKSIISIDEDNIISYNDKFNSTLFTIDGFDKADVWLIEIDSIFHVIKKNSSGKYYIQSDYSFELNYNSLKYYIEEGTDGLSFEVDLSGTTDVNEPKSVNIYRLNFTDISDFDTSVVETDWSNYEYEKRNELSKTDEPKLYKVNLRDSSNPKEFDEFILDDDLYNIPTSSEYIASLDIFEIYKNSGMLSDVWRKNTSFVKWGYQGSISNNDCMYKGNNSFLAEDFNRDVNVFEEAPSRIERNLDYFYTINPDDFNYSNHSLHITGYEDNYGDIDTDFRFSIKLYMNAGIIPNTAIPYEQDYFDYIFNNKDAFESGRVLKNKIKYSIFIYGNDVVSNSTLFRGIKFNVYEISNISFKSDGYIDDITAKPTRHLDEYKLSILLSSNEDKVMDDEIVDSTSSLEWLIVNEWELEREYELGDIVSYQDILWKVINDTSTNDIKEAPSIFSTDWENVSPSMDTPLWNPGKIYLTNDWIYRKGEYYYDKYTTQPTTLDFWLSSVEYQPNDKVIYKGKVYLRTVQTYNGSYDIDFDLYSETIPPLKSNGYLNSIFWELYSETIDTSSFAETPWRYITQWKPVESYLEDEYTVYDGVLYKKNQNTQGVINPKDSPKWTYIHSIEPKTETIYNENDLLGMNDSYYVCLSNPNGEYLDNGVDIYINKRWKNVFINIYNNDNTLPNLSNTNRDDLYTSLYSNITAKNFTDAINDLDTKYGFINHVRYIVIDEDGSYEIYNHDGKYNKIPYLLEAQMPDELEVRTESMNLTGVEPPKNLYKVNRALAFNEIKTNNQLNYYNGDILGVEMVDNFNDIKIVDNFSGLSNTNYISIYRFSGNYTPILYNIELFKRPELDNESLHGNYLFDTTLTDFGMVRERIHSKVNHKGEFLKLKDLDGHKSVYPVIDEFGYSYKKHFIFKSPWDLEYYLKPVPKNNI